ncbi:uncharacterized protein LOC144632361 [Oculina patagonica]
MATGDDDDNDDDDDDDVKMDDDDDDDDYVNGDDDDDDDDDYEYDDCKQVATILKATETSTILQCFTKDDDCPAVPSIICYHERK